MSGLHDLLERLHRLLGVERIAGEVEARIRPSSGWVESAEDDGAGVPGLNTSERSCSVFCCSGRVAGTARGVWASWTASAGRWGGGVWPSVGRLQTPMRTPPSTITAPTATTACRIESSRSYENRRDGSSPPRRYQERSGAKAVPGPAIAISQRSGARRPSDRAPGGWACGEAHPPGGIHESEDHDDEMEGEAPADRRTAGQDHMMRCGVGGPAIATGSHLPADHGSRTTGAPTASELAPYIVPLRCDPSLPVKPSAPSRMSGWRGAGRALCPAVSRRGHG